MHMYEITKYPNHRHVNEQPDTWTEFSDLGRTYKVGGKFTLKKYKKVEDDYIEALRTVIKHKKLDYMFGYECRKFSSNIFSKHDKKTLDYLYDSKILDFYNKLSDYIPNQNTVSIIRKARKEQKPKKLEIEEALMIIRLCLREDLSDTGPLLIMIYFFQENSK